jgi:hypothetical protein
MAFHQPREGHVSGKAVDKTSLFARVQCQSAAKPSQG